jgi:biotin carboxyl carrier protein
MILDVEVGGRIRRVDARGAEVTLDGRRFHVDAAMLGDAVSLIVGPGHVPAAGGEYGRCFEVSVAEPISGDLIVYVNGRPIVVSTPLTTGQARERITTRRRDVHGDDVGSGPHRVLAPMPGRVAKVLVKVGDVVAVRQSLVVVEAMKMENELRSPRAGTVVDVRVLEGARVEANALLVVVE